MPDNWADHHGNRKGTGYPTQIKEKAEVHRLLHQVNKTFKPSNICWFSCAYHQCETSMDGKLLLKCVYTCVYVRGNLASFPGSTPQLYTMCEKRCGVESENEVYFTMCGKKLGSRDWERG